MRDALPAKERARLSVLANQQIQNAASSMGICCVGLYCAMGGEINLGSLAQAWERQGVRLAAPVTLTGHRLAFVEVPRRGNTPSRSVPCPSVAATA